MFNKDNIWIILDYLWQSELKDFEESYDTEVIDDLDKQIEWCELEGCIDHIFYNLMLLKRDYKNG